MNPSNLPPVEDRKRIRDAIRWLRPLRNGATINGVAREIGWSWGKTAKALEAMGITLQNGRRIKRDQKIIKLAEKGESYAKIGATVGLSRQRVQQILARERSGARGA